MPETGKHESGQEAAQIEEKLRQFGEMEDDQVANSVITGEIFKSGKEGETEVIQRIDKIGNQAVKDSAWFRLAKIYYDDLNHINAALEMADRISGNDERTRCLVQLAIEALKTEHNLDLVDDIIGKAKMDNQGYLKYFEKEKIKIMAADKDLYREHAD